MWMAEWRSKSLGGRAALSAKLGSKRTWSGAKLENVQSSIVVGAVDQAGGIDAHVGRLDNLGAVGTVVDHARRFRRHQGADLFGPVRIANVERAYAGVLIGGKDQLGAHEGARPVLVDVVRTEVPAPARVVGFRRRRKGGDADGVFPLAVVKHPNELEPVLLMIEHGLVENDQQVAVRQWQAVVGPTAERRRPVAVRDEVWARAVCDIDHHHAG